MKVLTGIRATGQQTMSTTDEFGNVIDIVLYFQVRTASWKIDVEADNFSVKGLRISHVPNLLNQYKNIISFGMGVIITDGGEPFLIDDFSTERVQLAILTVDEVTAIESWYVGIKDAG